MSLWRPSCGAVMVPIVWIAACARPADEVSAAEPAAVAPWFTEVAAEWGIDFVHDPCSTGRFAMPEIMGAGVALFDADADGDLDLDFTSGVPLADEAARASGNRFYRNDGGAHFHDATEESGLACASYGMGLAVGDLDNDDDLDLFLTSYGTARLFQNDGKRFEERGAVLGANVEGWSTSTVFLDHDRDGFLDLYVARYLQYEPDKACRDAAGRADFCGPKSFRPQPDVFLQSQRGLSFSDASAAVGVASVSAAGLGVVLDDFDADGWIDVYVANDGYANNLWRNDAGRRFVDVALERGAALSRAGETMAGMGVVSADLDSDQRPDLFVTNLFQEPNSLFSGGVDGVFSEQAGARGLGQSSKAFTSFGTVAADLELDGDLDVVVVNGRVARGEVRPGVELPPPWDAYAEPRLFYANDGSGRFALLAGEVANLARRLDIGRAALAADLDGDGDLDLVHTGVAGPARVLRNDAPHAGAWLAVRARDPALRRDAVGAIVRVHAGGVLRRAVVGAGGSYLSASSAALHFGLGPVSSCEALVVTWPDGSEERFDGGPVNREVLLVRGEGAPVR